MTAVELYAVVVCDLILAAGCVAGGYWLGKESEATRAAKARDDEWDRTHGVTTTVREETR